MTAIYRHKHFVYCYRQMCPQKATCRKVGVQPSTSRQAFHKQIKLPTTEIFNSTVQLIPCLTTSIPSKSRLCLLPAADLCTRVSLGQVGGVCGNAVRHQPLLDVKLVGETQVLLGDEEKTASVRTIASALNPSRTVQQYMAHTGPTKACCGFQ